MTIDAVLFDLDGTLADTAPDLAAAANTLLTQRGRPEKPLAELRPWASQGTRGLIGAAFGIQPGDAEYRALADAFLEIYADNLCVRTTLFEGMPQVLAMLERLGMPWGIVTNKASRFTEPLIDALGLARRAAVVVSGDTTAHAKPHPLPLIHATQVMRVAATQCVYVGDDERDIVAGRAAQMRTVAARYGYCAHDDPMRWAPDASIDAPGDLIAVLAKFSAAATLGTASL